MLIYLTSSAQLSAPSQSEQELVLVFARYTHHHPPTTHINFT